MFDSVASLILAMLLSGYLVKDSIDANLDDTPVVYDGFDGMASTEAVFKIKLNMFWILSSEKYFCR